jgi:ATP-dependent Zn protease
MNRSYHTISISPFTTTGPRYFLGDTSSSAGQEILYILCSPEVQNFVYSNTPPVPILSQINPVLATLSYSWIPILILYILLYLEEARGGAFDQGTALQAGRSRVRFPMVSLKYFFRPHYGPGNRSASNRNEYQEYFLGVKAAGA